MKNKRFFILGAAILVFLLLTALAFNLKSPKQTIVDAPPPVKNFSIVLNQQNQSGESGLATFAEQKGKTIVTVKVVNAPLNVPQPAHLHTGTCEKPVSELFDIEDIVNGESKTVLDISIKELLAKAPFVINLHKSYQEDAFYTSCGTIYPIK